MIIKKHLSYPILFSNILVFVSLGVIYIGSPLIQTSYAHIFTPNEYASFIAFADYLKVESELVKVNLDNNLTLAQAHANNSADILFQNLIEESLERNQEAGEILITSVSDLQNIFSQSVVQQQQKQLVDQRVKDINTNVDKIITSTIEEQGNQGSNFIEQTIGFIKSVFGMAEKDNTNTIQPMRVAELADSVLRSYGNAYGVGFDMTNMSNMVMGNDPATTSNKGIENNNTTDTELVLDMPSTMNMGHETNKNNYSLINMAEYQSAQSLAKKTLELFNSELKPLANNSKDNDSKNFITNLENGLVHLTDSINNKSPPMDVMMIVHTQVHPNLLSAFNLETR